MERPLPDPGTDSSAVDGRSTGNALTDPTHRRVEPAARSGSEPSSPQQLAARIAEGARSLELSLPPDAPERLASLAILLSRWAERINLTAHRSPESAARRLILDGLALGSQLPEGFDSLADLGSGAGFPGLPLAVVFPQARFRLVESRERRHHFQRAARRTLALENVELVLGRAERAVPVQAAVAVAQAAGPAAEVLGWLVAWCRPGGWIAIPGGEEPPDLPSVDPDGRYREARVRRYAVPLGGPERSLWLARRPLTAPD